MRISAAQPSYHDCRWCLRVLRFVQLEARLNATEEEKVWLTVGIPTVPRKTRGGLLDSHPGDAPGGASCR